VFFFFGESLFSSSTFIYFPRQKKDDSFGFAKGDTVRVLEGELANLTAKVLSVNNATKMVKVLNRILVCCEGDLY
jgi:transcription antitermination factor NusG